MTSHYISYKLKVKDKANTCQLFFLNLRFVISCTCLP